MAYERNEEDQSNTSSRSLGEDNPNLGDSLDEATDGGRTARVKAERVRTSAARGLDSAADAMHAGGDHVARTAHRAGDALASGAQYVRTNDPGDMVDDFMDLMRKYPGPALFCAAALGFLFGRAVYRH